MEVLKVISTRNIAHGCVINEEIWKTPTLEVVSISDDSSAAADDVESALSSMPDVLTMTIGRNSSGDYIGDEKTTIQLVEEMGISPETSKDIHDVCSIGFCEGDGKWYGWSHRAIYGFEIGSLVKRGDCAYEAPNETAFGVQVRDFFCDSEWKIDAKNTPHVDADGRRGVLVTATYTDDVPNEKLRGTEYRHFSEYPEQFGRGEWMAETIDDAKQMAKDFAESVS